ncbi:hypothetical protein GJ496_011022 [Pomphorhynchus laevis]|nr:hypothetical protein GJ496_011022 [Pomphorhynchus laevis]
MIGNAFSELHLLLTNSYSKFRTAIATENLEKIKSIASKQPRILSSQIDNDGNTSLGYAIMCESPKSANTLIECGADVDVGNVAQVISPLHMMGRKIPNDTKRVFELIDLLIQHNCQIDVVRTQSTTTPEGYPYYEHITPLMDAIVLENIDVIEKLAEKGGDVNFVCEFSGNSPLLWAATTGNISILRLLLKLNADVKHASYDGNTVLHWLSSCSKHNISFKEIVELLLEKGCALDSQNSSGQTALMLAISKSACSLVDILLSNNSSTQIEDIYGFKAIDYANNIECAHCIVALENTKDSEKTT